MGTFVAVFGHLLLVDPRVSPGLALAEVLDTLTQQMTADGAVAFRTLMLESAVGSPWMR